MELLNLEPEERCNYYIDANMKKVWNVELDLLKKLLDVCDKYNLKCFVDAGTLLGAVRHKGFIPWDDDIDVVMFREDYDKLLAIGEKEFSYPYFLQDTYSDVDYILGHAQLRNSMTSVKGANTTRKVPYNEGIFVDIFALDGVSSDKKVLEKQKRKVIRMKKMLVKYFYGNEINTFKSKLLHILAKLYFNFVPYKKFYKKMEDCFRKVKVEDCEYVAPLNFKFETEKRIRNKHLYDETVYLDFENIKVPAPKGYNEFLEKRYGDYMKPAHVPTTHGEVIFNTEKSYLEVREEGTKKKRFCTIFPHLKNEYLMKPNGMLPYTFMKEFGYDGRIVTYKEEEYNLLKNINGVKIDYLENKNNKKNDIIDVAKYIFRNAKEIDILHTFNWKKENYIWITLYKFLNKNGKVYITMDADERIKNSSMINKGIKRKIKMIFLKKCDLISAETEDLTKWLQKNWYENVKYVPLGIETCEKVGYKERENIICTVGRIGAYQKDTQTLLRAYKLIYKKIPNWKLRIVGPIQEDFKEYIDKYVKENPGIEKNIEFTGAIFERDKLMNIYKKAKIFCLTSRYESYCLALHEAASKGCYIISSNIATAKELVDLIQYGDIFEIRNEEELAIKILKACNNEILLEENCNNVQEIVNKEFSWESVCRRALYYIYGGKNGKS